jgi:DNA-binding transcriptional LysR family regulator
MDSTDLRVFEAVARLGAMNRAATELNTVQSNVTSRIRQLEEATGTRLFERHSQGVALTAAGQRLLPFAQKVAEALAEASRALRDDGRPNGSLVVGSLETTAALRLSPVLSGFAALYPSVDLVLRTGTSSELVEDVLQHRLEGAFVCGPVHHPQLEEITVYEEELVLITAKSVRSIDDLNSVADLKIVVLRAGCSYRLRLESFLARRGVVGFRQLEFGTLESIFGCVSAGLGITLLPKSLLGPVWRTSTISAHELPSDEGRVDTVFIRRRDAFSSSALTAFVQHAVDRARLVQAAE